MSDGINSSGSRSFPFLIFIDAAHHIMKYFGSVIDVMKIVLSLSQRIVNTIIKTTATLLCLMLSN